MTTLKQLLELTSAIITLIKWFIVEEKKMRAEAAVAKSNESMDQSPVEGELDHASLGHTTAALASVRIEPIKDRSKH
jgi:hypothetical protein